MQDYSLPHCGRRPGAEVRWQNELFTPGPGKKRVEALTSKGNYGLFTPFRSALPELLRFMYAVLETGSKQYRVAAGDRLEVERLTVEAGQTVTFDRVLLVNNDGKVTVGSPTVPSASVEADVLEHIRGDKKIAFKMKRRKGYHKTIGHRQELTVVKIKEIKA
jgi:large subunit ribosomal protein L21